MSARPLHPVPLVSRPRPGAPALRRQRRFGRWKAALFVATFSLAALLMLGTVWTRLIGNGGPPPPPALSPPPSPVAAAAPLATATRPPDPTATAMPSTPTIAPTGPPSPTSTPTLLDEGIARALVERYYTEINGRDFQGAYALLGTEWHGRQSYDDFAAGYRGTVRDAASVTGMASASKDAVHGYVVALDLEAQTASRTQRYKGLYFVALEGASPRIENGELSPA